MSSAEQWSSLVAVAGTLGASVITFVLQDRAQQRRGREAGRDEHQRELQVACSRFAAAADTIRRTLGSMLWTELQFELLERVYAARADLSLALQQLELLTSSDALIAHATQLADAVTDFATSADHTDRPNPSRIEELQKDFVTSAKHLLSIAPGY